VRPRVCVVSVEGSRAGRRRETPLKLLFYSRGRHRRDTRSCGEDAGMLRCCSPRMRCVAPTGFQRMPSVANIARRSLCTTPPPPTPSLLQRIKNELSTNYMAHSCFCVYVSVLQLLIVLGGSDAHKKDGLSVGFSQKTKLFTARIYNTAFVDCRWERDLNSNTVIFVAYEAVFYQNTLHVFTKNTLQNTSIRVMRFSRTQF
jgi:hypothetical protein